MNAKSLIRRTPGIAAMAAGVTAVVCGAAALAVWYAHGRAPDAAASTASLQPDLGIGFICCGAGLMALSLRWWTGALISAAGVVLIALLACLQPLLEMDFSVVRLLSMIHVARFAPRVALPASNAVLSFALIAAALPLLIHARYFKPLSLVASCLAAAVFSLAAAALLGTGLDFESANGWGLLTAPVVQAVAVFLLIGGATFMLSLGDPDTGRLISPPWLPAPLLIGGLAGAWCVWRTLADLKVNLLKKIQALFIKESFVERYLAEVSGVTVLVLIALFAIAVYLGQKVAQRARKEWRTLAALRKANQDLQRAHQELGVRVEERTAEISKVNRDLEKEIVSRKRLEKMLRQRAELLVETDRRKDEFFAILGHELRNPLAMVSLGLDTLALEKPGEAGFKDTLELMKQRLRYLVRLVDDLLDVSRVASGKIKLKKSQVQLQAAAARSIESLQPIIREREHTLTLSFPEEPILLEADDVRLEQIISNLISNAAKYTHPGGRIWVQAQQQGDFAVLTVKDTGVGISKDQLTRIFDSFIQADRSLDQADGGLGIGLTLVHRLVSLHGGTVFAVSDGPGKGSEFVVRLPALAAAPAVEEKALVPVRDELASCTPRRVLIVDDKPEIARLTQRLLKAWGHDVSIAYEGQKALEIAASTAPEVALVDIGLPGMNGYELAGHLRKLVDGILLVAMTGYTQPEHRRRIREAGFDYHLVKPVELKVLRSIFTHSLV